TRIVRAPFAGPYHLALSMPEANGIQLLDAGQLDCTVTRNGKSEKLHMPGRPMGGNAKALDVWYDELSAGETLRIEVSAARRKPVKVRLPLHARVVWEIWHLTGLPSE